jgi:uncharacterized membrane protein YjjB (DUF3815 family)
LLTVVEERTGLTVSGLAVLFGAVIAWFIAHLYGGRDLYLIAYAAVGVTIVSVVLARRRRPVTAERSELARRARVGQSLDVEVLIS